MIAILIEVLQTQSNIDFYVCYGQTEGYHGTGCNHREPDTVEVIFIEPIEIYHKENIYCYFCGYSHKVNYCNKQSILKNNKGFNVLRSISHRSSVSHLSTLSKRRMRALSLFTHKK